MILLILSAIAIGTYWGFGWLVRRLADHNILFAPIPDAGCFAFVSKKGLIVKILENVVGKTTELSDNGEYRFVKEPRTTGNFFSQYGDVWIGMFSSISVFEHWKWFKYHPLENNSGKVEVKEDSVSSFRYQFPHTVQVTDVEIGGNIKVTITMILTVHNLYPVRMVSTKDPAYLFSSMVEAAVRPFIRNWTFDEVKGLVQGVDNNLLRELKKLNGIEFDNSGNPDYTTETADGLVGRVGFAIVETSVVQVEASDEASKALEATRLAELRGEATVAEARKVAEAAVVKARGEAEAIRAKIDAEEERIRRTIVDPTGGPGSDVARVLVTERIQGSQITTWVEGGSRKTPSIVIPVSNQSPKKE